MKSKSAMAISIAGVLLAGSAAAFVNTHVLDNNASPTPVLAEGGSQTLPTGTTSITIAPTVTPTTTSVAATAVPAQPAATVAGTQAVYTAADAGTVTLDTAGDVLTIVGVVPLPGWTVIKSENEDSQNVEVKFQNGAVEVDFHANMQFGVVSPSVEIKDGSATSNSATSNSVDDSGHGGGDDNSGPGGGGDNSGHGGGGDD